jgi:Ca2+-binding RTX toxin-like protein
MTADLRLRGYRHKVPAGGANNVPVIDFVSCTLSGAAGNDTLDGGLGADTLLGGAGNDVYVVDNAGDKVFETTATTSTTDAGGVDRVESGVSWTLGSFVEQLTLTGTDAINGTGNTLANLLTGNAGNNVLNGAAGNDTLVGGLGDDSYVVDSVGDVITEQGDEGTDTVSVALATAGATYTLGANVEHAAVTSTVAVNLTGNALANTLIGNAAANVLNGGAGDDVLVGGLGNDSYVVDSVDDVVTEGEGEGTDAVSVALATAGLTYTLGANVENATVPSTAAIHLTGNELANSLTGNASNNTLTGGAGNDSLTGAAGNDTLVGGLGDDVLVGGPGNDVLTGGAGQDVFRFDAVPNATSNRDTLGDFVVVDDTIELLQSVFTALDLGSLTEAAFFASATAATAADADDHIIYNTTSGVLYYDADGAGGTAAVQCATLAGSPDDLSAMDFGVVA